MELALIIAFFIFFGYGLMKGYRFTQMATFAGKGMLTVKNIILTFLLIGMLTALWRAAGTIPVIICSTSWMIKPSVFLLVSFLLNCLMSFLTGTSFGTAATMGVICMTMGSTMHINPLLAGGSILSGIFFGDRCSPVSTSALLVSELTGTDIYRNIKEMCRYAAVPFGITCIAYFVLGFFGKHADASMDVKQLFSQSFQLHWIAILPACIILLLSLLRIKVKMTMLVSILAAVVVCMFIQNISPEEVLRILIWGYRSDSPEIAAMLNGGGILSMRRVAFIVCLSSSYAGMFEGTHMLDTLKERIAGIGEKIPTFGAMLGISVLTSAVSCNQTLSIILTNQLCEKLEPDSDRRAIMLEDAPVLIAPLIPWSIAGAVPVTTIGATSLCLFAAFYLYSVPLWHLAMAYRKNNR